MEIEFLNGEKNEVGISTLLLDSMYNEAIAYDFALLKANSVSKTKFSFLKVGDFGNINDGDRIYSNGYPLGMKYNFISTGILSTKWVDTLQINYRGKVVSTMTRNVAWLDLTMNKGNSGGPVIKLGKTPEEDEVIGIATFILNPYAQEAENLAKLLSSGLLPDMQMTTNVDGKEVPIFSNNQVSRFFAEAISKNSIGVSGCVSINHLLESIK